MITEKKSNLVKIEVSPYKKSSVKIRMQVHNVVGGEARYTLDENNKKVFQYKEKEPKSMTRLPNTLVEYTAGVGKDGTLLTGLTHLVENPYSNEEFYRSGWEIILKGKDKVRLQELLEYKHNKPIGYYTNQVSDIRSSFDKENIPFYQKPESRISLKDGVTYLNLDNPNHEINYYMLKAHKMIANSFDELKLNPEATHYIVKEEEKIKRESESVRKYNKLGARLEKIFEMPEEIIINFTKALGINRPELTKESAYGLIDSHCRNKDSNFDDFMAMYDLWDDMARREVFMCHAELSDLLSNNIVSIRNNKIYWVQPITESGSGRKEHWEWKSKEDFIKNFLLDPRYNEEVAIMRNQLKHSKYN